MSYPRGLDEYSDEELVKEIKRRTAARKKGLCSYCGQKRDAKPCRYPELHSVADELTVITTIKDGQL